METCDLQVAIWAGALVGANLQSVLKSGIANKSTVCQAAKFAHRKLEIWDIKYVKSSWRQLTRWIRSSHAWKVSRSQLDMRERSFCALCPLRSVTENLQHHNAFQGNGSASRCYANSAANSKQWEKPNKPSGYTLVSLCVYAIIAELRLLELVDK